MRPPESAPTALKHIAARQAFHCMSEAASLKVARPLQEWQWKLNGSAAGAGHKARFGCGSQLQRPTRPADLPAHHRLHGKSEPTSLLPIMTLKRPSAFRDELFGIAHCLADVGHRQVPCLHAEPLAEWGAAAQHACVQSACHLLVQLPALHPMAVPTVLRGCVLCRDTGAPLYGR